MNWNASLTLTFFLAYTTFFPSTFAQVKPDLAPEGWMVKEDQTQQCRLDSTYYFQYDLDDGSINFGTRKELEYTVLPTGQEQKHREFEFDWDGVWKLEYIRDFSYPTGSPNHRVTASSSIYSDWEVASLSEFIIDGYYQTSDFQRKNAEGEWYSELYTEVETNETGDRIDQKFFWDQDQDGELEKLLRLRILDIPDSPDYINLSLEAENDEWVLSDSIYHEHNSQGQLIESRGFSIDPAGNSALEFRTEYTYPAPGVRIETDFNWDASLETWKPETRTTVIDDPDGEFWEEIIEKYENNTWIPDSWEIIDFDDEGLAITNEMKIFNTDINGWETFRLTSYTRNGQGFIINQRTDRFPNGSPVLFKDTYNYYSCSPITPAPPGNSSQFMSTPSGIPNPYHSGTPFELPEALEETTQIELYDLQGRLQVRQPGCQNACQLRTGHLPPGLYFLVFRDKTGKLIQQEPLVLPGY